MEGFVDKLKLSGRDRIKHLASPEVGKMVKNVAYILT